MFPPVYFFVLITLAAPLIDRECANFGVITSNLSPFFTFYFSENVFSLVLFFFFLLIDSSRTIGIIASFEFF